MDVVKFLDDADIANDPNNPPQFTCEKCGKEMYRNIIEMPLE